MPRLFAILLISLACFIGYRAVVAQKEGQRLVTGKTITPMGEHVEVGSYPANLALSPDGKFVIATNTGFRQYLSVLGAEDGKLLSQLGVNANIPGKSDKQGLYWGLAWGPSADGKQTLYASRGSEDKIAIYEIDGAGKITDTGLSLSDPSPIPGDKSPNHPAGIATNRTGTMMYAANNDTTAETKLKGSLSAISLADNKVVAQIETPGFPFAVAAITPPGAPSEKVYVTSERDGVVTVIDAAANKVIKDIRTGEHPMRLLPDAKQERLFVANASSDTISIIDTKSDRVAKTVLLRPNDVRGLVGCSPTGMSLSPDERTLYVTLADLNAVAIVDLPGAKVEGYLPTGWYPTAVEVTRDGKRLFVANAKGVQTRNPNNKPVGTRGTYVQNIIEGTVAMMEIPDRNQLAKLTKQVLDNNFIRPDLEQLAKQALPNPGIEHIIYIIKENRTYDQVLSDLPRGNGDPSLCLFPRSVTPNLHALADRFVLFDNFYCPAEVSYDGWQWSTAGMASEYTSRNAPYNYSGRGRLYDGEGQNNGVPADLFDVRDVAVPGGGYFWEHAAKHGVDFRNYGFFGAFEDPATRGKLGGRTIAVDNAPTRKSLVGTTDIDYRIYDTDYADSEAWVKHNCPSPKQIKEYGKFKSQSRFTEWKREFDGYMKSGKLPKLTLIRLGNDHTVGTSADHPSPRAMVADNDYAVGQLVEAVSHSPFWKKTAIFVVEDDSQAGQDHVDCHRSIAFVISPFVKRGLLDSRFYNTDSVLRTMGLLMGLPPLCQYDAVASPMAVFNEHPVNDEPYSAILPAREIVAELNRKVAYRSQDSPKFFRRLQPDTGYDAEMNDILWGAIKGAPSRVQDRAMGFQVLSKAERGHREREEDEEEEKKAGPVRRRQGR